VLSSGGATAAAFVVVGCVVVELSPLFERDVK
jgi:hypothetical protein